MIKDTEMNLMARLRKRWPDKCVLCEMPAYTSFVTQKCVGAECKNFCPSEYAEYHKEVDDWWEEMMTFTPTSIFAKDDLDGV